jgi:hypothetical protein
VTRQKLDSVWVPRIGERGVEEFLRYRRSCFLVMPAAVLTGVGGVLCAAGPVGVVFGVVLFVIAGTSFVNMFWRQRRFAAVLSDWYGAKVRGVPALSPERFDAWRDRQGLRHSNQT